MFPVGVTAVSCTATDAVRETVSCGFTVSVNPPAPQLSRTTFLAFGDSLTAGEITSPVTTGSSRRQLMTSFPLRVVPSASYPAQLAGLLTKAYPQQSADISMTNAGKPGEWAANAFSRFESEMRKVRPAVVLLLSGYNEIISRGEAGIPLAAKGVEAMAREARLRGAVVFIATLPPPSPDGQHAPSGGIVFDYNTRLKAVAAGERATIVDLYRAMRGSEAIYIGSDGIHPTEAGYRRMAETFFAAIQARLEVR